MNEEQKKINRSNRIDDGANDEYVINLADIIGKLWSGKLIITFITGIAAILSVILALQLPIIYKATALVVPYANTSTINSTLLDSFAGVPGIDQMLGSTATNQTTLALQTLQSFKFFKDELYENIIHELSAVESWNPATNALTFDKNIYNSETNEWVSNKPTYQGAYRSFQGHFEVARNNITGMVNITVEHASPVVAKKWVDLILEKINMVMRQKDIEQATLALEYYDQQARATSLIVLNEMFANLSEIQHKQLMLANVVKEYAFETIDPAVVSERRDRPNRGKYCLIFTVIAGVFSVVIVLIKDYIQDLYVRVKA